VDPLDGTKEFLKKSGEFTVNVALIERGKPVLGVVHAPALGLTYFAEHGEGAFRQKRWGSPASIRTRSADSNRLVVAVSRDHVGAAMSKVLARMPGVVLAKSGSSLKFCLVAEGQADLYLRDVPTMEWDTAAAQCVVEEAGGMVCDWSGNALGYGKPDLRNPSIITLGDASLPWRQYLDREGMCAWSPDV
jgi:3'(2'), 5'-bisphosphate nucleotidase